jgi:predicted RNA-binding Zn-ribbon protein involved in translation (DUF1610 family)
MQISATRVWEITDTDLTPCTGCKEMIISDRYVLFMEMKGLTTERIPTGIQLCQSCYEGIKPQENETEQNGPE